MGEKKEVWELRVGPTPCSQSEGVTGSLRSLPRLLLRKHFHSDSRAASVPLFCKSNWLVFLGGEQHQNKQPADIRQPSQIRPRVKTGR